MGPWFALESAAGSSRLSKTVITGKTESSPFKPPEIGTKSMTILETVIS